MSQRVLYVLSFPLPANSVHVGGMEADAGNGPFQLGKRAELSAVGRSVLLFSKWLPEKFLFISWHHCCEISTYVNVTGQEGMNAS